MSSESVKTFSSLETPGYVGFANLPNQVHRKSVKKGFEFTLMVVGESGLGKSTLVNSLFLTDLYPNRKVADAVDKTTKTVELEASTVEIEERGVKLRLTVVDTPGFGDAINNTDSFRAIIQYIDDQFERFLRDESGLNRRNIIDNRVHCCFYFISPFGHGTKPLDIEFMKQLHNKVNIVPVIAKADVLTKKEILRLKKRRFREVDLSLEDKEGRGRSSALDEDVLRALVEENPRRTVRELAGKLEVSKYPSMAISRRLGRIVTCDEKWILYDNSRRSGQWLDNGEAARHFPKPTNHQKKIMEEIEENGIKIYPLPDCDSDEDEDYKEQVRQLKEAVPFAVCGSNTLLEARGRKVRGRLYPWGVVEVENPDHCDFIKLRTMLITHMQDLQEVTQEVHYENYRSERLAKGAPVPKRTSSLPESEKAQTQSEKDKILQEKEAELRRMQEMLAKMQAQMHQQQPL
ncbi:septin 1 isoform X1 [Rhodnius prolixus]